MTQRFFRISDLPPYPLGEVATAVRELRNKGIDVVDLSKANPTTAPPAVAVDRLVQTSLQVHNHRYSASSGISRLREALTKRYRECFDVQLDAEREVAVSLGTKEGIAHLLLAVLSPGATVLVPTPAYPVHTAAVFLAGASFAGVPLFDEGYGVDRRGFLLTAESNAFFTRLTQRFENTWPRPKMMLASFPHNPTTMCVTKCFWERLLEFCRKNQVYLVHDFAYADLVFTQSASQSVLAVGGAKELAVETYSLSKGFGLGGWRIGFVAGCPELVAALKQIKGYLDFGAFQPLQLGAATLLEQPKASLDEILSETLDEYRSRRDLLVAGLKEQGWGIEAPQGSIFLWARLPKCLADAGSLAASKLLLEHAHVASCPGEGFDADAREYVRFALVEPERRIHIALQKMGAFLNSGESDAASI